MALRFAHLTRAAVNALPPGRSVTEHGITVRKQRDFDDHYSINIMVDGQRIHRAIGRASEGITREQAERAIESFRTKAREGRLDLPTGRKAHRTFADAAGEYLRRIEGHPKHGRNIARKRYHLQKRLVPYFRAQRYQKLTDFAIAGYIRQRKLDGAAQATINRELSSLSHFLSRCLEWGWIKSRPKIDKGVEPRKRVIVLSDTDKRALTASAIGDQDAYTWLFVAIAMSTGMRHSEILRVQWTEVDFASHRIHIARAKAGQREQPMPPSLAVRLKVEWQRLGHPTGFLFPTNRADAKHPHRQNMAKQFRRAVERAKLDPTKVTPHILRHTAITELVRAGVDLPTIQKISGHKTLAMVLRYTQLTDEHVSMSVAKLDNLAEPADVPERATS
ncbi:MAG: site-specific integrase [Croceibacterium sp.]